MPAIGMRDWRPNFKDGFASKNKFQVLISGMPESISLLATGSSIPGSNVGKKSAYFMGGEQKYAGDLRYQPWNLTLYVDYKNASSDALEQFLIWTHQSKDRVTNAGKNDASDYYREVTLNLFAEDHDSIIMQYVMLDCYVAEFQAAEVSWANENEFLTYSVVLEFSNMDTKVWAPNG